MSTEEKFNKVIAKTIVWHREQVLARFGDPEAELLNDHGDEILNQIIEGLKPDSSELLANPEAYRLPMCNELGNLHARIETGGAQWIVEDEDGDRLNIYGDFNYTGNPSDISRFPTALLAAKAAKEWHDKQQEGK